MISNNFFISIYNSFVFVTYMYTCRSIKVDGAVKNMKAFTFIHRQHTGTNRIVEIHLLLMIFKPGCSFVFQLVINDLNFGYK